MAGGQPEAQPRFAGKADGLLHQHDDGHGAEAQRAGDDGGVGGVPHEERDAEALHGRGARHARHLERRCVDIGPKHERRRTLYVDGKHQQKRCARQPRGAAYAHGQVVRVGGLVHTDILSHCRAAYHAPRAAVYCC